MYIPYFEIAKILSLLFPKLTKEKIQKWGYNAKVNQNLKYIKRNKQKLITKLKTKSTLKVIFYVYDETKWKCESVYNLMKQDKRFEPLIVATKNNCKLKNNPNRQTSEDVKKTYNFFKTKGYKVEYGYNTKTKRFIPFKKFKPDVIIYQHPWYVETSQGPVVCSKFALTCYVPYFFPTAVYDVDYHLRFHQYIEKYYVLNEILKDEYSKLMSNHGCNLKAVGYPFLDYFSNKNNEPQKYVIYAPHWSVAKQGIASSTFEKYGNFILDYAKKHPEHEWVFKPHPLLYKSLIKNNIMTEQEVKQYYNEWAKVGFTYDMGNYIDIFNKSQLLISDNSSFLGEYFMTGNPVIYLVSDTPTDFSKAVAQIIDVYYHARNKDDLKYLLDILPEEDYLRKQRRDTMRVLDLDKNTLAAKNIIQDIINELN